MSHSKTILIMRPEPGASFLQKKLQKTIHNVIYFPVTQIVSCPIVLPEEKIGSYNSLLVTSSNGLRFL